MTAGFMVPLLSVGVAVADLTMRLQVRDNMQRSADSAVLAAIGGTVRGWRKQQRLANGVFRANLSERKKIDRLQTRLRRGRKPGYRVLRYEAIAKMNGLLGGANPLGDGTIKVSATAAKNLYSLAPPKLISEKSTQGSGSNSL